MFWDMALCRCASGFRLFEGTQFFQFYQLNPVVSNLHSHRHKLFRIMQHFFLLFSNATFSNENDHQSFFYKILKIKVKVFVFEGSLKYYNVYRVSQEEMSIIWEVIVSVFLSKNVYVNMCPIPNGFRDRAI